MFRICKDTPAYYLTSVAKERLPVFRKDNIKESSAKRSQKQEYRLGFCSSHMS